MPHKNYVHFFVTQVCWLNQLLTLGSQLLDVECVMTEIVPIDRTSKYALIKLIETFFQQNTPLVSTWSKGTAKAMLNKQFIPFRL